MKGIELKNEKGKEQNVTRKAIQPKEVENASAKPLNLSSALWDLDL